jgi:hypothetical protein
MARGFLTTTCLKHRWPRNAVLVNPPRLILQAGGTYVEAIQELLQQIAIEYYTDELLPLGVAIQEGVRFQVLAEGRVARLVQRAGVAQATVLPHRVKVDAGPTIVRRFVSSPVTDFQKMAVFHRSNSLPE